jgi:hypothetical protein
MRNEKGSFSYVVVLETGKVNSKPGQSRKGGFKSQDRLTPPDVRYV